VTSLLKNTEQLVVVLFVVLSSVLNRAVCVLLSGWLSRLFGPNFAVIGKIIDLGYKPFVRGRADRSKDVRKFHRTRGDGSGGGKGKGSLHSGASSQDWNGEKRGSARGSDLSEGADGSSLVGAAARSARVRQLMREQSERGVGGAAAAVGPRISSGSPPLVPMPAHDGIVDNELVEIGLGPDGDLSHGMYDAPERYDAARGASTSFSGPPGVTFSEGTS